MTLVPKPSWSFGRRARKAPAGSSRDRRGRLIDQLRADGVVLTYHPDGRILRAGDHDAPSVTVGKDTYTYWLLGYPFAVALMLVTSVTLYLGFKRRSWL